MNYGTLDGCEVYGNYAWLNTSGYYSYSRGGGIYANYGTIRNCNIHDNKSASYTNGYSYGGGLFAINTVEVTGCVFKGNDSYYGGGIFKNNTSYYTNVTNCIFEGNQAQYGSAIDADGYLYITNCLVNNNYSRSYSAIYSGSYTYITNSTIVNNKAANSYGVGVYPTNSNCYVINSIVWGNRYGTTPSNIYNTSNVMVSYSAIEGGFTGLGNINLSASNVGTGTSPCFASPTEGVGIDYSGGDWTLTADSPMLDFGIYPVQNVTIPASDLAGNDRVQQNGIDMGAYESSFGSQFNIAPDEHNIIYVTTTGTGNGSSWANATNDLNSALMVACRISPRPVVWMAAGTYTGNGVSGSNAFILQDGVSVYGGFVGNEAWNYDLSQRNLTDNLTVLDGQDVQRVLYQEGDFSQVTYVDGLVIERGRLNQGYGAGAYIRNKVTLQNCVIRNNNIVGLPSNNGTSYGAGVYATKGNINHCDIYGNAITWGGTGSWYGSSYGAGAYLDNASAQYCNIHDNNNADSYYGCGGGVYLYYSSISNSTVQNNTAKEYGGGVYAYGASQSNPAMITYCEIFGNESIDYDGGGVYASYYTKLTNCTISNNIAGSGTNSSSKRGGGVFASSYTYMTNCLVSNNTSKHAGGGVYFNSVSYLTNCDIVNNLVTNASSFGGGLYVSSSDVSLKNCVVWGNECSGAISNVTCASGYLPAITYSAIQGGWSGTGNVVLGAANTGDFTSPYFTSPTEGAGAAYSDGDWTVQSGSALVNKGTTQNLSVTLPDVDLAGNSRVQQGIIDLGCYESEYTQGSGLQPDGHNIIYVTVEGAGQKDGSSWDNACDNLNYAVSEASGMSPIPMIWVKEGRYFGDGAVNGSAFIMQPGVNVYGGFEGTEAYTENWQQRQYGQHVTILDGQNVQRVLMQGVSFANDKSSVWNGFTIENGHLTADSYGAGAYLMDNGALKNCIIRNDTILAQAASYGAGVFMQKGRLENCEIYGNYIGHIGSSSYYTYGGGVYAKGGNMLDCFIHDNGAESRSYSYSYGGGVYCPSNYQTVMERCIVTGNYTNGYGGGFYSYGYSSSSPHRFVNCRFENNNAYQGGGAYAYNNSELVGCNVANNTASNCAGGAYVGNYSKLISSNVVNNLVTGTNSNSGAGIYVSAYYTYLTNSIVWGNRKGEAFDQYYISGTPTATFCAIQGGYDGTGNIALDDENEGGGLNPCFANPSEGVGAEFTGGDWSLTMASACINQGTTSGLTLPETDLAGNVRVQQGAIDVGAFESPYNAVILSPDEHNILYVTPNGAGAQDGSSWANATPYLQLAANRAGTFAQKATVWVAQGTYQGNGVENGNAFTIPSGIAVYGSFVGDEAYNYDLSQRDFVNHASILDGQNVQRVLYQRTDYTAQNAALWDGFTLTNGAGSLYGAGAYLRANAELRNCIISGNVSSGNNYGGGVYLYGSSDGDAKLTNCKVIDNEGYHGGGVYSNYNATLTNCLIAGNMARYCGGGVYVGSNTKLIHCGIYDNAANNNGGGIYFNYNSENVVRNSVVWGNVKGESVSSIYASEHVDVSYSAVEGGYSGVGNVALASENLGNFASPCFVAPEDGDWNLTSSSILINKGGAFENMPEKDLAGNARVQQGTADMGPYESPYESAFDIVADANNIIYVKLEGMGNGSSWTDATGDLQMAVNFAATMNPVATVWVAKGTYYGSQSQDAFTMVPGVNVYGGFAGTESADFNLNDRDFITNMTFLDGDEARRVLCQNSNFTSSTSATWDGFTIRNGYCQGYGAGVYMRSYSHLRNCVVTNNVVNGYYEGAGIYVAGASGIHNTLTNCEITNNTTSGSGAGVCGQYLTLTNCKIKDNISNGNYGGGAYLNYSKLINCELTGNRASQAGGVYLYYSDAINTTIANNTATNNYGGLYNYSSGSGYTLANLIIWGNKKGETPNQYYNSGGTFTYCAIQGYTGGGTGNINLEADNDGDDVTKNYVRFLAPEAGIYQLQNESSVVGMGNNSVTGLPEKDLAGRDRIMDGTIEPGAYEQYCTQLEIKDLNLEYGVLYNFYGSYITEPGTYTHQWSYAADCDSLVVAHVTMNSSIWYVTTTGAGTKDGSSWANASDNLNTLLNNISQQSGYSRKQVWVAGGTYHGATSGTADFYYVGGVEVHGGFAGNETYISERDPEAHPTILSGSTNRALLAKSSSYPCTEDSRTLWEGITFEGGKQMTVDAYLTLENCTSNTPTIANGRLLRCDFSGFSDNGSKIMVRLNEGAILDSCLVHNNSCNYALVRAEDATVRYTLFYNNTCTRNYSGGGEGKSYGTVLNAIDNVLIDHCDFVNNRSEYTSTVNANLFINMEENDDEHLRQPKHALISLRNSVMQNSIVWGNEQAIYTHDFIAKDLASEINYCAIENAMYNGVGNIVLGNSGNFVPDFVNPTPNVGHLISIDDVDWSLGLNSICHKQGTEGSDLGAIASTEASHISVTPTDGVIYVAQDGEGDGSSWANATSDLQYAVAHANTTTPAAQVWVKEGSYTGDGNGNLSAFNVVAGVEVYGGFAGNETSLDQRDPAAHPTFLDGMASQRVLYQNEPFAEEDAAVWDGFVIRNGYMNEGSFYDYNGAILVHPVSNDMSYNLNHLNGAGAAILANTTLRNISFENNRIVRDPEHNSGISNAMKGTTLSVFGGTLDHVVIAYDTTEYVSTNTSMVNSYLYAVNATMEACDFNHNIGKIALYGGSVNHTNFTYNQVRVELPEEDNLSEAQLYADFTVMRHCRLAFNNAVALNKRKNGSQYANTFHDCQIDHNNALAIVGHSLGNNDQFINCNINNNKSNNRGSNVYPISGGVFHNTVVWGNRNYSDLCAHFEASRLAENCSFNNCAVEHGLEGYEDEVVALAADNTGTSQAYEYPCFLAPVNGDYTLTENSALIDAGDNSVVAVEKDFIGNDRIMDETVEIGAYEYKCVLYREYNDVTMNTHYPFYGEWLTESGQYVHRWAINETCDSVVVLNLSFKHIIYVTEEGGGLRNGTSWENAFGSLKDATEYAGTHPSDLNQIWVAEGLYRGDGTSVNAFRLFPNTQMYGGLTGTELADYDLSQRDIANHETILDGDYIQRVIYQVEDCTADTPLLIDGFTIKNGFSRASVSNGTALSLKRYATIRNCKITENYTNSGVEAIYMYNDDFESCDRRIIYNNFINCELTNNQGGYVVVSDHCAFTNCKISGNNGFGIYVVTYTRVEDCQLIGNGGRAIRLKAAAHKFTDPFWGTEKYSLDYLDMTNTKVTNNKGGIHYEKTCKGHGEGRITSCLFANNSAMSGEDTRGGAIFGNEHEIDITCSTFVNNTAKDDGGALYGTGYKIVNTILSGNKASGKANQLSNHYYDWVECEDGAFAKVSIETSDITYSAIEGGYPGEGNIGLNNTDLKANLDGSYRPNGNSPCVNNGTTSGVDIPEYDMEGHSRVLQGRIDIGAYESDYTGRTLIQPDANNIIYVSSAPCGNNDGSSWDNATSHFQMSLNFALCYNPRPQIWVKKGTYGDDNAQFWSNLAMMPGVNVYGGLNGDEPANYDLSQRDLNNNLSVLTGNSVKRVLEQFGDFTGDDVVTWDGFHIKSGYAREGYVRNIKYLSENSVESFFKDYMNGGGVLLRKGGNLSHCEIYDNVAFKGGGIYRGQVSENNAPTYITNSKLRHNYAIDEGGAIFMTRSSGIFGGGESPIDTIANCEISGNNADRLGALHTVRAAIIGTSIIKNTTDLYAFDTISSGHQYNHLVNCVMWGNDSRNYAFQTEGRNNTYDYCAIQGGAPAENTGTNIIDLEIDNTGDNPELNYPFFLDDEEEIYRPTENSAFVNQGDNENVYGDEDLAFKQRVKDDVVDMGAYEESCLNYEHKYVIANRQYNFYGRILTESGKYEHQWTPAGSDCDSLVSLQLEIRCIWYVKEGGAGLQNGSSWENATGDLNWAISQASACDTVGTKQVWVAQGTYRGNGTSAQAFTIKPNIEILGGFEGNEEENIDFDSRDFANHASILDGSHCQRVLGNYGNESNFGPMKRATIDGFTIQNGYTTKEGGGVYAKNYITMKNLVVKNNQGGSGAGIYVDNRCEVSDCDIFSNTALHDGGGAWVKSSTLTYCEIYRNLCDNVESGSKRGGGIYGNNATINNCLIANNSVLTSGAKGGGMYIANSQVASQLLNCTMVNNYSYDLAGGVYSENSSSNNEFINCVLWGNKTDLNTQQIAVSASNVPIYLRYCAVQGGAAGIGNIKLTAGNNTNDLFSPKFVNPSENVGANYGGGDWRFQDNSILANHGERLTYTITKDLDDETRVKNSRIDIGAYESNYTHDYAVRPDEHNIIYVDAHNNSGNYSGDSWANAIPDLQLAINFAGDNDNRPKIWIAGGTYTGNGWPYVDAFVALNGIDLYGGFAGNEAYDYDLDDRDLEANATILDGQNIQRTLQQAHSTYFKYKQIEELHSAIYDGLTLKNGFVYKNNGGVVMMQKGNLNRCIIENGEARDGVAGGLFFNNYDLIVDNTIIRNCKTTASNTGSGYNGGGYNGTHIIFHNCLLANNSASGNGGAGTGGTHYNSTIVNNYASVDGGGLYIYNKVYNSVLWGNKIGNNLPCQLRTSDPSYNQNTFGNGDVLYSAIEGGFAGEGNITLNVNNSGNSDINYPMFVNPSIAAGAGNGYVSDDDDWSLEDGSVLVNHGKLSYVSGTYDLGHNNRVQREKADMGAYESPYDFDYEIEPDANNIIYVTQFGAGLKNGSSWEDATPYLQFAMERATLMSPRPQIWMASGIYTGSGVPQYPAFNLPDNISLYGGFAGNEPASYDLSLRDFDLNITRLDGQNLQQIMRRDYTTSNNRDILNGITFQNGRSNREGGAAYLKNCDIDYCQFLNNTMVWEGDYPSGHGGGALNSSNCHIYHSTFMNNYSNGDGGAIKASSDVINWCLIKNNTADKSGGGINGSPEIYNTEISYNHAEKGGGLYGAPRMKNSTVVKNTADVYNGSANNGGGMYLGRMSGVFGETLYDYWSNNIVWGNRTGALVSNVRGIIPASGTISYTAFESDETFPAGTGNIVLQSDNDGTNPSFNYVRFADPDNGDFSLQESSMCINVGNNATAAPGDFDLADNERIQDAIIDMGAYEMTPVNCHVPTGLIVPDNEITFTTANVYWTPADEESEWMVYYMQVDEITPHVMSVDTNFVMLSGLQPNLEYFVKVRSVCSASEMSGYTLPVYFNTACDPESIVWNNYLDEEGLLPVREQALQSNEEVLFSWDYIEGADYYDLYLWRTDYGNGLEIPDFPVKYGIRNNYATVNLGASVYQGYGAYEHCFGWACDPEPPLYLHQYDTTGVAYYAWYVVAHQDCAVIQSDTMTFTTALPDLHVTALDCSYAQTGQVMTVEWTVKNDGVGPTPTGAEGTWNDYIVLSYPHNWTHQSFTQENPESFLMATVPNLTALNPGESYTNSTNIFVPDDMYGTVFLFVLSNWVPYSDMHLDYSSYGGVFPDPYLPPYIPHDPGDPEGYMTGTCAAESFREIVECDNFFYKKIEVDIPPYPDLIGTNVIPPYEGVAGDTITVSWMIVNQGRAGFENRPVTDIIYMTTDTVYSSQATQVATYMDTIPLMAAGDTIVRTMSFVTDERSIDTFNFFVRIDATNTVYESLFEGNNMSPVSVHSTILLPAPPPDLTVTNLTLGMDTISPYEQFPISYRVKNIGYVAAKPLDDPNQGGGISDSCGIVPPWRGKQWSDFFYLSDQPELNTSFATSIGSISNDTILYLPTDFQTIDTMIMRWAECHFTVPDTLSANASHADSVRYYEAVAAVPGLIADFYDEQHYFYKNGDTIPHNRYINSYMVTGKARTPHTTQEGKYYFYVWTDKNDAIFEYQHEDNNIAVDSIYVVQPDLTVENFWINDTRDSLCYVLRNIGSGKMVDERIALTANFNNAQVGRASLTRINLNPGDSLVGSLAIDIPCNFYEVNSVKLQATPQNDKDFTNNNRLDEHYLLKNPDFMAHDLLAPTTLNSGDSFDVVYDITNKGSIGYTGDIELGVYLGLSPELNFITAQPLDIITYPIALAADSTETIVQNVTLPIEAQGPYYIYIVVNDGDGICEGDNVYTNYIVSDLLSVTLSPYPDLLVTDATQPGSGTAGMSMDISYTATNQGIRAIAADETWTDAIYVSNYPQFSVENAERLTSISKQGPLAIGDTYSATRTVMLPNTLATDNYYIYIVSDVNDNLFEYVGEYNNTYQSVSFPVQEYSLDLAVTSFTGATDVEWAETVSYSYTVHNFGSRPTVSNYEDRIYLSDDATLDANDLMLAKKTKNDVVSGGGQYNDGFNVTIPYGYLGDQYLLVVTDYAAANPDSNAENNVKALAVNITSIPVPDLEVSDLELLTEFPACGQPIEVRYKVTNVGDGPTYGTYADRVVLSRNTYDHGQVIATETREDVLNPGEYYYDTATFIVPVPETGNYAFYVNANHSEALYEMNRDNNLGMLPVVVDLNAPGDLIVTDIDFPSQITAGNSMTITWKVKNLGPNTLTGVGCSDVVYLSTDTIFDADDRLLGNIAYDLSLMENVSEQHQLEANISGVQEGEYYIIVYTDARNTFYEIEENNNRTASLGRVRVELPILPFNEQVPFTMDNFQYKDYKLVVGSNISETVRVYVTSTDSLVGAVNNIYVLHDGVGTNLDYDISTDGQMTSNSELYIPRTEPGYYGVSVFGYSPAHPNQQMTIEADILPFEIRSISPNRGGNTGKVTVKLIGSKFRHDMEVILFNATDTIQAEALQYVNFNEVFVTFDLKGARLGTYSVRAINYCAGAAYLHNGFTVVEGEPENLSTNLIIPVGLRANRYCCLTLEYGNIGNTDIVNPRIVLRSLGESWIGLRRGELNIHRTELEIPTQFEDEPDGVLRPGVRHTITIYCYTNAEMLFSIDVNDEIDAHEYIKNLMLH